MIGQILATLLPVFLIAGSGAAYGRFRTPDIRSLNTLNMELFVPLLVFAVLADRQAPLAEYAWLASAAALVVLGLVRPALKAMSQPVPVPGMGGQLDALEADQPQRPALGAPNDGEPTVQQLRLEDARALALANPMAVANIMKNWVNGEAA